MTDYETASLTLQHASVEIGRASVWATYVQAGIAGVVGLIQCALIAWGLKLMHQSTRHRDQQHEEAMAALRQQGDALKGLSETNTRQHEETMAALRQQGAALQSVSEGIREMGEGIREMIARTRPA